jgi:hypothetical protein
VEKRSNKTLPQPLEENARSKVLNMKIGEGTSGDSKPIQNTFFTLT